METKEKMIKRAFTYADIEKFHQEHWGKYETPVYTLTSIKLLTEVSPPTWQIEHKGTYSDGDVYNYTLILVQQTNFDGTPWLNLPYWQELPSGLASVEEEDAEMERQVQTVRDEWEKKHKKEQGQ